MRESGADEAAREKADSGSEAQRALSPCFVPSPQPSPLHRRRRPFDATKAVDAVVRTSSLVRPRPSVRAAGWQSRCTCFFTVAIVVLRARDDDAQ